MMVALTLTVYDELIDEVPRIVDGCLELPQRPELGVALNESLFDPARAGYRSSAL